VQGFIDRRTDALRALDALLDQLDEEDGAELDVEPEAEHGDGGDNISTPATDLESQARPMAAMERRPPIDRQQDLDDDDDTMMGAASNWWRQRSPHGSDTHTTARSPGGSSARDLPTNVLDLLRQVGRVHPGERETCPHGGDPLADLPKLLQPPGYVRGADGVWRYEVGGLVPGARDDNLASRYRFAARSGTLVLIPVELTQHRDLLWVKDHHDGDLGASARWWGRHVPAYAVPRFCWNVRSRIPLGLLAPEVTPPAMLDLTGVARLIGVKDSTVTSYRARGRLPAPQFVVANTPLWSWPVIDHWIRHRGIITGRS
jgi:hypothetical protein